MLRPMRQPSGPVKGPNTSQGKARANRPSNNLTDIAAPADKAIKSYFQDDCSY